MSRLSQREEEMRMKSEDCGKENWDVKEAVRRKIEEREKEEEKARREWGRMFGVVVVRWKRRKVIKEGEKG